MALQRSALLALFLLALSLWGASGAIEAQAIDCNSTTLNNSERSVCASRSLRSLAASVDRHYTRVADGLDVKQSQLEWIGVRDRCNGNVACLMATYRERSAYFAKRPATVKALSTATPPRQPIKHLFLRHATAQLLVPAAAPSAAASKNAGLGDPLDRAAGPIPVRERAPNWKPLWLSGGVLLAAVLLWQMLTNVCGKCPNCHHWFARVEIDQRNLVDGAASIPVTRRRGFRQGAAVSSPAIAGSLHERVASVRHYYQCRICLHEWETTRQETHSRP